MKDTAIIITGAGRGIGRAAALRLATEHPLVLVGLTPSHLDAVASEVGARGGNAIAVAGDVVDPATAKLAVEAAHAQGRKISGLVASAGIGKGGPTHAFAAEDWKRLFDV